MKFGLTAVSTFAIAVTLASTAQAQTTSPAEAQAEADAIDEEVVVTGSRLRSTVLTSVAPITAVDTVAIEQSGRQNIADILTDQPQIGVGLNGANTQRNATSVGLNQVDLRRLGGQRTLVLINGRRQVSGQPFTAAVDLNSVPSAMVERVEVVTGGTSAVYGADAVSGAINIVLKRDFEGLEARAFGGVTSRGDGESYGLNLIGGQSFGGGRGNIVANVFYDSTAGVQSTQRSYGVNGINTIRNPADTANNDAVPNFITSPTIRFVGATQLASANTSLGRTIFAADGGSSRPYSLGSIGNQAGRTIGGDGGFFEQYDNLSLPIERIGGALNVNFEASDGVNLFLEARVMNSKVLSFWQPVADDFVYAAPRINVSNPFVPADFRAQATAANISSFQVFRVYDDFGRRGSDADRLMQQYTVGVEGKAWGDWTYEAYAGYGHTRASTILLNGRQQDRFLQSVDVILLNGAPACADPAARAAGCQPLNPFNPSSTPAGIAYSLFNDRYRSTASLAMVGASMNGTLFNLPAGPVALVVGAEARDARARTEPSADLQTGRTYYPQEAPVSGSIKVKEAFGELRVPLLADITLVKELTFQAAARVSDYNVNGTQTSWNAGGVFSPVDGVRFRVMRSKAARAPNITELFSPANESFFFVQDPCDVSVITQAANRQANCTALGIRPGFNAPTNGRTTPARVGGNPNLDVETAYTWTAGAVFTPNFAPGLSLTIDYYDIHIRDAIGTIPIGTILNNCVDLAGPPSANPLCSLITRDPTTFGVTNIVATQVNIGQLATRGIDFALAYGFDLVRVSSSLPGRINLNLNGNYLIRLRQLTDGNDPRTENQREGFLGDPKFQVLGSLTYSIDKLAVTWRGRYLQSTDINGSINLFAGRPTDQFDVSQTGDFLFNDLSVNYEFSQKTSLRVNVNNLFDVKPPQRGLNIHQGINDASIYPNLGASFVGAVTHRF
ncbi:TonB-dependent receptor plug domain-containing protein [Sphingomonas sp. 37zxx]|uniref:TonB-dependent receptor plug domain-containing protein n=1 Tax=Sphingomonas sp. 37zxx TaxID=1550073 RepID=UPI00053BE474|nr:TonB-dependent receptor [Sphingomonas sp. 37zxx]